MLAANLGIHYLLAVFNFFNIFFVLLLSSRLSNYLCSFVEYCFILVSVYCGHDRYCYFLAGEAAADKHSYL